MSQHQDAQAEPDRTTGTEHRTLIENQTPHSHLPSTPECVCVCEEAGHSRAGTDRNLRATVWPAGWTVKSTREARTRPHLTSTLLG